MFKLEMKTGNAAFQDGEVYFEVKRILIELLDDNFYFAKDQQATGTLHDINGNAVGKWSYKP